MGSPYVMQKKTQIGLNSHVLSSDGRVSKHLCLFWCIYSRELCVIVRDTRCVCVCVFTIHIDPDDSSQHLTIMAV